MLPRQRNIVLFCIHLFCNESGNSVWVLRFLIGISRKLSDHLVHFLRSITNPYSNLITFINKGSIPWNIYICSSDTALWSTIVSILKFLDLSGHYAITGCILVGVWFGVVILEARIWNWLYYSYQTFSQLVL